MRAREVNRIVVALLIVAAWEGLATAAPWTERCKARLVNAAPALRAIGKATITIAPPAAPRTGEYEFKDDGIGEVSLVIAAGLRTFTATVGADRSGHRHRAGRGLESVRYEEWHSPYVDSRDGKPPDAAIQPLLEEFHHRLAGSIVRGELRIDASSKSPSSDRKLFADTLRPVLAACWSDVLPDEADTSLGWTTKCVGELQIAHAALVKQDPIFRNGTCAREQFGASCGNVKGAEPTWNALTSLAGGRNPKLAWIPEGPHRKTYANGRALIWSSDKLSVSQTAVLFAAFEKPLERCAQLLHDNMYDP